MSTVIGVLNRIGPKLIPFFNTVGIYFIALIPYDKPSFLAVILKCLPIVSLMLFVVLHGIGLEDKYRFSRKILIGQIFCCIGDAFLVWHGYFEAGMLAFMLGHLHYIQAYGFKPLNLPVGIIMSAVGGSSVAYLYPGLRGIDVLGVPIYSVFICTMIWRAISRVGFFDDSWTWSKLCTCGGSILFAISDFIIGVDRFLHPVANHQILIMSTYYAAQLGIALSVVDETNGFKKKFHNS